jgi:hypothetical protein
MENFLRGKFQIKSITFEDLPLNVKIWSYAMVLSPILCIPGYAIYKLLITPGKTFDEVK